MKLDIKGRQIKPGDLLKIPHFRARRRRQMIYMYMLVVLVDDKLNVCKNGEYQYAMGVADIFRKLDIQKAHKCPLHVIGECEIIDDQSDLSDLFWERPSMKAKHGETGK